MSRSIRRNSCLYGTKHGSCFSIRSLTGNGRKKILSFKRFLRQCAKLSSCLCTLRQAKRFCQNMSLFHPFSSLFLLFFVTLLVRAVFWIGCFSRSVYKGPAFVPPFEAHFSVKQVPGGLRLVVFTGKSWNIIMYRYVRTIMRIIQYITNSNNDYIKSKSIHRIEYTMI